MAMMKTTGSKDTEPVVAAVVIVVVFVAEARIITAQRTQ
jgi:hypothetical protein